MSDLNNKHLPSDIDSLTRKDLVELFHIQMAENQKLVKQVAELERERDKWRRSSKGLEKTVAKLVIKL